MDKWMIFKAVVSVTNMLVTQPRDGDEDKSQHYHVPHQDLRLTQPRSAHDRQVLGLFQANRRKDEGEYQVP